MRITTAQLRTVDRLKRSHAATLPTVGTFEEAPAISIVHSHYVLPSGELDVCFHDGTPYLISRTGVERFA